MGCRLTEACVERAGERDDAVRFPRGDRKIRSAGFIKESRRKIPPVVTRKDSRAGGEGQVKRRKDRLTSLNLMTDSKLAKNTLSHPL